MSIVVSDGDPEEDSGVTLAVRVTFLLSAGPFCFLLLTAADAGNVRLVLEAFCIFRDMFIIVRTHTHTHINFTGRDLLLERGGSSF